MQMEFEKPVVFKDRPYQAAALDEIREHYRSGYKKVLLHLATGGGKCLAPGTEVLKFNGETEKVENLASGDLLMGPDSKPRKIVSTCTGREMMYRISPVKGEPWACNESHLLSLVHTVSGQIKVLTVGQYLEQSNTFKHTHKLFRVGVDFTEQETPLLYDPYILGIYLAEGSKGSPQITNPDKEVLDYVKDWASKNDLITIDRPGRGCRELSFKNEKPGWYKNHCRNLMRYITSHNSRWIPKEYKCGSAETRLQVLAGLLDGDGYYHHGYYEIITKHDQLKKDILFLARSLGFAAYSKIKTVRGKNYHRITISGDLVEVPCKIERKKTKTKKAGKKRPSNRVQSRKNWRGYLSRFRT